MSCPVIIHATGQLCDEPVRSTGAGLCGFHYGRRNHGWSDAELGLPRNANRTTPPPCQIIEAHTGLGCPRPHVSSGLCRMHYGRRRRGWTEDQIAQPAHYQRPQSSRTRRGTCPMIMHTNDRCGRPVEVEGICGLHYKRILAGWPPERLGEAPKGTAQCGARTDTGPCRAAVPTVGDRCPAHPETAQVTFAEPARRGTRRAMTVVDAAADALEAEHRNRPNTAKSNSYRFRELKGWARRRRVSAEVPMPFETFACYLASLTDPATLDPGRGRNEPYSFSFIRTTRSSIRDAHLAAGHPSPTDHADMPALWRGIRRTVGARSGDGVHPITEELMRSVMSHPPEPTPTTLENHALLHCVRTLDVDPHDLAGAAVGTDKTGAVQVTFSDGRQLTVTGDAPEHTLRALLARQPSRTWRFHESRLTLAGRQSILLDRAGLDPGRRGGHITRLTQDAFERCLLWADSDALRWLRDRSFMLVAWHLCLEHHEWAPLRWDTDISRTDDGYTVTVAAGAKPAVTLKLQPARDPLLCAVRALDTLRAAVDPRDGDLAFPSRYPSANSPLRTQPASKRIKAVLERIPVDPAGYATGSLPRGFIVTAIAYGADEHDIARTARLTMRSAEAHVKRYRAQEDAIRRMHTFTRGGRR